jgi:hypothetical protein
MRNPRSDLLVLPGSAMNVEAFHSQFKKLLAPHDRLRVLSGGPPSLLKSVASFGCAGPRFSASIAPRPVSG